MCHHGNLTVAQLVRRRHGRDTNTYPPMPNTTGTIINNPNAVLIAVSRFRYVDGCGLGHPRARKESVST
ncbi:hypothetical protein MAGR_14260 [Mycolicibacterium agri]|uniref:Uncharacterized protein n=1 Tax=Mycolicibacterium agri TaxID=36811 RepID=A0A7I9VWZ8_MYCAG|nr:hypothetical protein MAGR_14260 [Mycolicibacterium agri]